MLSKSCYSKLLQQRIRSVIGLCWIQAMPWKRNLILKHGPSTVQLVKSTGTSRTYPKHYAAMGLTGCSPMQPKSVLFPLFCPRRYTWVLPKHRFLLSYGDSMLLAEELGAVVSSHSSILMLSEKGMPICMVKMLFAYHLCGKDSLHSPAVTAALNPISGYRVSSGVL